MAQLTMPSSTVKWCTDNNDYTLYIPVYFNEVSTKPFVDLVKTLVDHLDPQTTEMGERIRLGRRHQHEGESVASFVAELSCLTSSLTWLPLNK